jgi:transcriptional antiterminator RfaH
VTNNQDHNRLWYAVHVRSNQETTTAAFLSDHDVEHFLPTYGVQSRRRDRSIALIRPLFTGYLFARIDYHSKERTEVLKAPGTVRIVSFNDKPSSIPNETMNSLKILVGQGSGHVQPHPLVQVGRPVRVVEGPFHGAIGTLQEDTGRNSKLVVEVAFLGRAVAIPIAVSQVQPVLD